MSCIEPILNRALGLEREYLRSISFPSFGDIRQSVVRDLFERYSLAETEREAVQKYFIENGSLGGNF